MKACFPLQPAILGVILTGAIACDAPTEADRSTPAPRDAKSYADRCAEPGPDDDDSAASRRFLAVAGAKLEPFRSVAKVTLDDGTICSAVLIAPDTLLSSAHCFEDQREVEAVEFEDSSTDVVRRMKVAKVELHPDYEAGLVRGDHLEKNPEMASADLAWLRLVEPVTDRAPVGVTTGKTLRAGKLVAIVGHGDAGVGSGVKRFAYSHVGRVVEDETIGTARFRRLVLLDSRSGSGTCPGDSGGGVFVEGTDGYRLIGVVNGVNDLLYPGFPMQSCDRCTQGIGIITRAPLAEAP